MLRLIKSFSVYAASIGVNAVLYFATTSFLTHHLTEYDYGVINLYSSLSIFLVPFIGLGISFTLTVDYFKMDEQQFRKRFTNAMLIPVASACILTFIFAIAYPFIQHLIKVNLFFAVLMPFSCALVVLNDVILHMIRNKGKHFLFMGFSVSRTIFETAVTLLLVVGLSWNWTGRLTGSLAALVMSAIISFWLIRKWKFFSGKFEKKEFTESVKTGLPFIPERLAIFVLAYSDRFFIDYFNGTRDVGYYSVGAQIALIVNMSILVLINVFHPMVIKKLTAEVIDHKSVKQYTWAFIGVSALVTGGVIFLVPFIFRYFIGPAFQPGSIYAINLSIGYFLWAVYNAFFPFLLSERKNKTLMSISIAGMIASLALNFYNVSHYGAIGATYSSMIVNGLMAVLVIYAASKTYPVKNLFLTKNNQQHP